MGVKVRRKQAVDASSARPLEGRQNCAVDSWRRGENLAGRPEKITFCRYRCRLMIGLSWSHSFRDCLPVCATLSLSMCSSLPSSVLRISFIQPVLTVTAGLRDAAYQPAHEPCTPVAVLACSAVHWRWFEPYDHREGMEGGKEGGIREVCILKDTVINKNFIFINVEKLLSR